MLDIIIPSYNDLQGLKNSLSSIGFDFDPNLVHITIIDDCSTTITKQDYNTLYRQYNYLNLKIHYFKTNQGPGMVRKYALLKTNQPYVLFLDCGDLLYSPIMIANIFETIETHPGIEFLEYQNLQGSTDVFFGPNNELLDMRKGIYTIEERSQCFHGKIIARSLLQEIAMPIWDPYHHEDFPYIIACKAKAAVRKTYCHSSDLLIIRTINFNSMTSNKLDFYSHAIHGMIANTIDILMTNNFNEYEWQFIIYSIMLCVVIGYLTTDDPKLERSNLFAPKQLNIARTFYLTYFKPIRYDNNDLFLEIYNQFMTGLYLFRNTLQEHYGIYDVYEMLETGNIDKLYNA